MAHNLIRKAPGKDSFRLRSNPRERQHVGRGQTTDHADPAQRRAAVHGDGCHGGRRPHRGRRWARHPHGGGAAGGAGARDRARRRERRARRRADRLHRDARPRVAAGAHRPPLCRCLRRDGRSGPRGRHHRFVGRLHPRIPRAVRARRPGGGGAAGLSALSPHPHRARLRAGADRDHAGDPLGDHARDAARGPPPGAAQGRAGGEPRQPDRHDDDRAGPARSRRCGGRRGDRLHLRRDLSRPRLCLRGRDRTAAIRQGGR